jgi:rhamnulose-1-phosphate aldolase/alcohol dehydrogenase
VGPVIVHRTPIVAQVEDRWPLGALPQSPLDQVLLASHLLGSDRAVANFGGGNTSAKGTAIDHRGRRVGTMWVKGSGSDLAGMQADDFTALRLEDMLDLFERDEMSDEDMVAYLTHCRLDPSAPRPSIETLLHAFIPAAHVHHTHPDAINVLASTRDGEQLVDECFAGRAAWAPYIRPGFELARRVGGIVRSGEVELLVLAKHGLVVWGDSAEQAYRRTIASINSAASFTTKRTKAAVRFGGIDDGTPQDVSLHDVLPALRGAVSSERAKVLIVDTSERTLEFVASLAASELAKVGAACPDHLVHTKRLPLWVPYDPAVDDAEALSKRIWDLAARYRDDYRRYVAAYGDKSTVISDPDARVVLVQHLGMVGVGTNVWTARLARDFYERAIEVMAGANALGGFVSLTEAESFAIEYWPLELYKLSLAPQPRELEGKVALITGAAGGIGRAVAETLAAAGATIVGLDIDADGASEAIAPYGESGLAVSGDVTSEAAIADAFSAAVSRFGGVDIVVSNAGIASSSPVEETTLADWNKSQAILGAGYFLVAREAFRTMRRQQTGGTIIFIASKNALVAGKNASAYSAAKATELHLARCLAEEGGGAGIRVNVVNPDAVLQGSRIWDSSWREERAAAYGISPDELEDHYRKRTTLGVNIIPEDVAEAVLHFASGRRSGKSTGNILNVDGGVAAAYPR